jgi:hypothetical protein
MKSPLARPFKAVARVQIPLGPHSLPLIARGRWIAASSTRKSEDGSEYLSGLERANNPGRQNVDRHMRPGGGRNDPHRSGPALLLAAVVLIAPACDESISRRSDLNRPVHAESACRERRTLERGHLRM